MMTTDRPIGPLARRKERKRGGKEEEEEEEGRLSAEEIRRRRRRCTTVRRQNLVRYRPCCNVGVDVRMLLHVSEDV
uniref:Uncharacterized protein n=1 Tax=Panulirus argus virus 1 TaxID=380624 RepID=A0A6G9HDK0_9VIRU|nr:hypothetical protein [Panulirus argus virus 1]